MSTHFLGNEIADDSDPMVLFLIKWKVSGEVKPSQSVSYHLLSYVMFE